MKKIAVVFFGLALLLSACSTRRTGNFQVLLTDKPAIDAQAIIVNITEISVHKTGGAFVTAWTGTKTYDLLKLQSKEEELIDVDLAEGSYTEIRMVVDSGQIVVGGQTFPLTVPSSEVRIPVVFEVGSAGATRIVLDFDAEKSIEVGAAGQSGKYILRPVITVASVSF